jgi:hypothetical protein
MYCLLFLYVNIYYILLTHQNLQKKIYTDLLNTFSFLNKKIEYLFIKQYQKVINHLRKDLLLRN